MWLDDHLTRMQPGQLFAIDAMTSDSLAGRVRRVLSVPSPTRAARLGGIARPLLPTGLHALLPLAVGVVWALVIRNVRLSGMTDLGLVSVIPRGTILLLFVLTASFCLSLTRRPLNPVVPLIHVVVLVVILYGVTTFLEAEPRVGAVYKHVGVMDYIGRYGSVNPNIDAYFNWPGFFALGALITGAAGFHSALAFAAWGPIAFNVLFLAPLIVIFRWASDDPRVTWLALWVFYSTNWVAQDHISPQALGYLLWLSTLAALLTWFTPRPTVVAAGRWRRRLVRLVDLRQLWTRLADYPRIGDRVYASRQRIGLLLLIVAMYGATVTGHQLTPIPVLLTAVGLVLCARLETRWLPVIMGVLVAAWVAYMATSFLRGHFSTLTGSVGHVTQNLGQSVGGRFAGSAEHQLIVNLRVIASAAIWLLAIAGYGRRLRGGRADVAIAVVAGTPFLLPAFQPYGGEILLRVFLFALPAVSFSIATLAFPSDSAGRTWLTVAGAAVTGCLLLGVFQYTRYGNERLDNFTKGDVAVVHEFYRIAPRWSTVFAAVDNLPWRYRDYADYDYRAVTELDAWNQPRPNAAQLAAELRSKLTSTGGGYVIVTRSAEISAELLDGRPGIFETVVRVLRASAGVHEIYSNSEGELFQVPAAH
jgi:hypothetical protein